MALEYKLPANVRGAEIQRLDFQLFDFLGISGVPPTITDLEIPDRWCTVFPCVFRGADDSRVSEIYRPGEHSRARSGIAEDEAATLELARKHRKVAIPICI